MRNPTDHGRAMFHGRFPTPGVTAPGYATPDTGIDPGFNMAVRFPATSMDHRQALMYSARSGKPVAS